MSTDKITATVIKSTLVADTGKSAYFMWFSQALKAGTKYTLVVITAKQYVVPDPGLATVTTESNELDFNQDYLRQTKTLSAGFFELSTVSSYLIDYMTYDSNLMFVELFVTPAPDTFQNFAVFPAKTTDNIGRSQQHTILFEPKVNHTSTRIAIYLSNSRFKFNQACDMNIGYNPLENITFSDLKCEVSGNVLRITSTTPL